MLSESALIEKAKEIANAIMNPATGQTYTEAAIEDRIYHTFIELVRPTSETITNLQAEKTRFEKELELEKDQNKRLVSRNLKLEAAHVNIRHEVDSVDKAA